MISGSAAGEGLLGIPESIIAIVILIGLSGFFAGSETALTGVSRARMHTLAKEGNKRAMLVNKIRERKDNMIGALMLGNTAVHVLASALAANALILMFGEAGVFYASLVMTFLMLVFGEVMPKTYALHHADSMAMSIAPVISMVIRIFAPVTALVTWVTRALLPLFGMEKKMVSRHHHLERLRGAIDLYSGQEEEVGEQRVMLRSILDLFDVEVEAIMIHRSNVEMISADLPMEQIVDTILENPYTRVPVWKDDPDNIIGILHTKLLLKELNQTHGDSSGLKMDKILMEPWYIPETTSLYDQLQAFRERREHFAIVVDEYGAFMGIVTLEDILEEIVGSIDDEQDVSVPGVRKAQDGTYLVNGEVTIRDLDREFNWGLPDEDYSTLAGLILHESQMIPDVGQSFSFYGFRFDVLKRQRNQITKVRVVPPALRPTTH